MRGKYARMAAVFAFVALAWVFFRAQSLSEAFYVFRHMFDGILSPLQYWKAGIADMEALGAGKSVLATAVLFWVGPLLVYDSQFENRLDVSIPPSAGGAAALSWVVYVLLGLGIVILSPKGVATEFVYFQF